MKFFQIVISIVVGMAAGCIPIVGYNMGVGIYYTDFAIKAFRIYLCMMVFACVNKACFIFLQAMGKALESTALSMIREIVFGVGFALLTVIITVHGYVFYSLCVVNGKLLMEITGAGSVLGICRSV